MSILNSITEKMIEDDRALVKEVCKPLSKVEGHQALAVTMIVLDELLAQSRDADIWHEDSIDGIDLLQNLLKTVNSGVFEVRLRKRIKDVGRNN